MKNTSFKLSALSLGLLLSACGRTPVEQASKGIQDLNEGRPDRAAQRLEKTLEAHADIFSSSDKSSLLTAFALATDQADYPADITQQALQDAVTFTPGRFSALYNLGAFLLQSNRSDEARPFLERAVQADPSRTEALELLAHDALLRGDHPSAVSWLEQARSRQETAPILTALAVARKNSAHPDDIRSLLQQATSLDPTYAPARLSLAAFLDANRLDPEQAISNYEAFLRRDPDSPQRPHVLQRMSIMADRLASGDSVQPDPVRNEIEALLAQAKAAQTTAPALALRLCLQANAIASRNDRDDLKERSLRAAATLVPDSPRGHYGLARYLIQQQRESEALRSLIQANRLAPEWPAPLGDLVTIAMNIGQPSTARAALVRSEEAAAQNANYLLDIADLYAKRLQEPKEARRIRRIWLERFPEDPRQADVNALL